MNKISILVGKRFEELIYWRVFANRELAEQQKAKLEFLDSLYQDECWDYFIQDEIVFEKVY